MFEISMTAEGSVELRGRLDASQVEQTREVLNRIDSSCEVDFGDLTYISSAGLGILFATQKRLVDAGHGLRLVNLNPHIRELFHIGGFDTIFEIG
jgi:anti-sigma B factor antagonist